MAWTTPDLVLLRWQGGPAPANDEKLAIFIEDAEDAILIKFPHLQEKIDSKKIPLTRVQRITAQIVARAYKTAYTQLASFSHGAGPYNESGTFAADARKYIALTDQEIADLTVPEEGNESYGMSSMGPLNDYIQSDDGVWHTEKHIPLSGGHNGRGYVW